MILRMLVVGVVGFLLLSDLQAGDELIVDLSGTWRFRTGDHITWRNVAYDDSHWDTIQVPGTWESQGVQHDGYAWYRKTFTLPEEYIDESMMLIGGKIDDADQIYVNGILVGSMGAFPPEPLSEWNSLRVYYIPDDLLRDTNTIAVRVYDMGQEGGIHSGPIGLTTETYVELLLNIRREPYKSFHFQTTANGFGATVVNTETGLVEHFYESVYKMRDSEIPTRDLLSEFDAQFTIDGEVYTLSELQPRDNYYRDQTGVITLLYDNGLLLDIFSPLSLDQPAFVIQARGDIGHQLDSFNIIIETPENVSDLLYMEFTLEEDEEIAESRIVLYIESDENNEYIETFIQKDNLLDVELGLWKEIHDRANSPDGLRYSETLLYEQSLSVLTMGQSREPGRSNGQLVASLPPGMWNITWVRDGAYAIVALAQAGLYNEARKGLSFYLHADAGYYEKYVHTDGIDYGIGMPYQISVCRYFGDGTEESDSNEDGPNIELDGFGLFLWALEEYVNASDDIDYVKDNWDIITTKIADVIVALRDNTGLIRIDSGPWERHLPGKRFAYTSIVNWRGLQAAAGFADKLGDTEAAISYNEAADSLKNAILEHLVDEDKVIKSNFETRNRYHYHYYDGAVLEAINMGLIEPDSEIAYATMDTLRTVLSMQHRPNGYYRVTNGDWYDRQEWIMINLRMVAALTKMKRQDDAEELLKWVVEQSAENYNLIAELYDELTAAYEGAAPMVGFGAGAYILAIHQVLQKRTL